MFYTLADARTLCGKFVDQGSCTNSVIDARINEALERLMAEQPWESARRVVRVSVEGRCFALPWTAGKILWADIDGASARIRGRAFQFLDSGPGDIAYRSGSGWYRDLEDLGDHWPVMYDIPEAFEVSEVEVGTNGWRLAAFTKLSADVGKTLTFVGVGSDGEEYGDSVAVCRWAGGVEGELAGTWGSSIPISTYAHTDILKMTLPVGRSSYVSLYAVDPSTHYMYFLAKYHSAQQLPQFRRYRITNQACTDEADVLVLVQLRHIPLSQEDDLLPITSLQALKLMVISISKENVEDLDGATKFAAAAIRVLTKAEEATTLSGGSPVVIDTSKRTSLGNAMNRSILL